MKSDLRRKLIKICNKYDVELMGAITNREGQHEIVIDHNFYYAEQEKMEREICKLGNIKSITYQDVTIG